MVGKVVRGRATEHSDDGGRANSLLHQRGFEDFGDGGDEDIHRVGDEDVGDAESIVCLIETYLEC